MPPSAPFSSSVERRLILLLAFIAAIAIIGVLAIVPYRLYERDIRFAEVNAHRIGSLLHVTLANALQRGTSVKDVSDLANRLQAVADLEIRLRELPEGETASGDPSGSGTSIRHDTDLTYTAPPILDKDGHTWLATMHFDLSPMKRESVRLIIDLVLAVLLGSAVFSLGVFWLIRSSLLEPLHEVTASCRALRARARSSARRRTSRRARWRRSSPRSSARGTSRRGASSRQVAAAKAPVAERRGGQRRAPSGSASAKAGSPVLPKRVEDHEGGRTEQHEIRIEEHQRGRAEHLERVRQGDTHDGLGRHVLLDQHAEQDQVEEQDQHEPERERGALGDVDAARDRRDPHRDAEEARRRARRAARRRARRGSTAPRCSW